MYIICLGCQKLFVDSPLIICVFVNTMNNSAQLEERELRLLVFLLTIKEMCSSAALECTACVCFLKTVSLGKNPLKLCKTVRTEATVRPWERQWNCVTHSETVRVEGSVFFHVKPNDFRFVTCFMSIFKFGLPWLLFEILQTKTKAELLWASSVSSKRNIYTE